MTAPVRALLFDLGGVLLDIDFARALDRWAPLSAYSRQDLARAFRVDEAYRRHERGELSTGEYFQSLRRSLALEADDAAIAAGWNAIFAGVVAPCLRSVLVAGRRLPCYAFSNSNATHKAVWSATYPEVVAAFRHVFVSSDLGLRKPEREAFARVASAMDVAPASRPAGGAGGRPGRRAPRARAHRRALTRRLSARTRAAARWT
jgi:putative hydrolase of the HAD superfamily